MEGFYPVRVEKIQPLSETVSHFQMRWKGNVPFDFKPGQFVMLDLPIVSEYKTRSYSIASAPSADTFELCIVKKEDGAGTQFLFSELKVGYTLQCSLPLGSFCLPDELPQSLVFICTGTGIAPFRAMLQYFETSKNWPHQTHLIFGSRTEADLLYHDEFLRLAAQNPNFHYYPVLSRQEDWPGYKGYVHQVYQEKLANLADAIFYLCGWSFMVKEAKNNLKAMGYHRRQIKFELYD